MGKYSESPIDNIQGYLGNIESILEGMDAQLKKLAAAQPNNNTELESLKGELASIRNAMDEIRKENSLVSASMNTIAEAIDTVPTEEERKRQHQEDLQFIVDNTKRNVTVDLEPSSKSMLENIPVDTERKIRKFVDKNVERVQERESWARYENWAWRVIALFCAVSSFLYWLIPRVKELNLDSGAGGFLLLVLLVIIVFFSFIGVYKWGKSQGRGWF